MGSGGLALPLLYADDTTLLATSGAGLQRQLDLLQRYCERWGLTVNAAKIKLLLLSGQRTQQAALETAQQAALSFAGQQLEAVNGWCFKYLGITFHACRALQRQHEQQRREQTCTTATLGAQPWAWRQRRCSCGCSAPWWILCCHMAYRCGACSWRHQEQRAGAAAQLAASQSGCTLPTSGTCWGCSHVRSSWRQRLLQQKYS